MPSEACNINILNENNLFTGVKWQLRFWTNICRSTVFLLVWRHSRQWINRRRIHSRRIHRSRAAARWGGNEKQRGHWESLCRRSLLAGFLSFFGKFLLFISYPWGQKGDWKVHHSLNSHRSFHVVLNYIHYCNTNRNTTNRKVVDI